MEKFYYIYNPIQADFMFKQGTEIVEIGRGGKGDIYVKFTKNELSERVFKQWCSRNDEHYK